MNNTVGTGAHVLFIWTPNSICARLFQQFQSSVCQRWKLVRCTGKVVMIELEGNRNRFCRHFKQTYLRVQPKSIMMDMAEFRLPRTLQNWTSLWIGWCTLHNHKAQKHFAFQVENSVFDQFCSKETLWGRLPRLNWFQFVPVHRSSIISLPPSTFFYLLAWNYPW